MSHFRAYMLKRRLLEDCAVFKWQKWWIRRLWVKLTTNVIEQGQARRCNEAETLPSLPKGHLEYYSNETLSERCAHYTSLFFRVITLKLSLRLAWIEFRHIHCGNLSAWSLISVWIIEMCLFFRTGPDSVCVTCEKAKSSPDISCQ